MCLYIIKLSSHMLLHLKLAITNNIYSKGKKKGSTMFSSMNEYSNQKPNVQNKVNLDRWDFNRFLSTH